VHRAHVPLTRTQRGRVRAGQMRLTVAYGTCRTQVGAWQAVSPGGARGAQR